MYCFVITLGIAEIVRCLESYEFCSHNFSTERLLIFRKQNRKKRYVMLASLRREGVNNGLKVVHDLVFKRSPSAEKSNLAHIFSARVISNSSRLL